MSRVHVVPLFLALLSAYDKGLQAERLPTHVYTNEHGLPQRQVFSIAQDPTGYLWLGTYGGLSRFNGRFFLTFTTRDGLSSNSITDIVPLADGRLWVATGGGGVCLMENLRATRCFRAPENVAADDVFDLEADGGTGVWVGTFGGVTHLKVDGSSETFRFVNTVPLRSVWSVKRLGKSVLVGFAFGVAVVEGRSVHLMPVRFPAAVRAILPTPNGVYVGSEQGLYRLPSPELTGPVEAVDKDVFVQDLAYASGTLWVATQKGLLRWRGHQRKLITRKQGLPSERVHRVFVDREGVLWLGTEAGLAKLPPGLFSTFTEEDGLPHAFVRAITGDQQGRLWVGTRGGLAVRRGEGFMPLTGILKSNYRVYDLLTLPTGDLLAATNRGVLQIKSDRILKVWDEKDGLPSPSTFTMAYHPKTRELFLGTWAGTVCFIDNLPVELPPILKEARPISMHVDKRGRLWVGLRDGKLLLREVDGSVALLGAKDGYSDQVVWCIRSDQKGVWLGTNGDGAFHVTEAGISRWDSTRGLVNDFVWEVLPDSWGRVWLFTSQGLDRIDGTHIKHFSLWDGLPEIEGSANACYEDSNGALWFGTGSGLVRFSGTSEQGAHPPPVVLLERATFGKGQAVEAGGRLPANPGPITFSLVSLSFRNEKALRYRYRLLPTQPHWSTPQPSGDVTFASVGPGNYRFEGEAIDGDGHSSPRVASLSFSVARPWWYNPFLWLFSAFIVATTLAAYSRFRVVRLRARAAELEKLVAERTRELAEKVQQLALIAETDELTGLANRRKFFATLQRELQQLSRAPEEARLSLLLLDLDGFKTINDTLGHNAGDALLSAVAKAIQGVVRTTDTVARFGGDEFAAILPMTDRPGAQVAAKKILEAIKNVQVAFAGQTLRVTASIGLAVVSPTGALSQQEEMKRLLQHADVALYAAKHRGGDAILDNQETWA